MISDVLSDAIRKIDEYLSNEAFNRVYTGELKEMVTGVRDHMEAVRLRLDTPIWSDRDAQKGEEEKMSKKVMKLIDERTGQMECTVCGAVHYAKIEPGTGGKYYRENWRCRNGCQVDESKKTDQ